MFFKLSDMLNFAIGANDGTAGRLEDIYFDDVLWNVRHFAVADAGGIGTQEASLEPKDVTGIDFDSRTLTTGWSKQEVAEGPDISADLPVSKQSGGQGDPHLRSVKEILGYAVMSTDGEAGKVIGLVSSDDDWKVHFVAVDTGEWNNNRTVLVAPGLIKPVDFDKQEVHLELDHARLKASPDYDASAPILKDEDVKLAGQEHV